MLLKGFESRIQMEQAIISKYMPMFKFSQNGSDICFTGPYTTTVGARSFELKLALTPYFPDNRPKLYIVSPKTLWTCNNEGTINSKGLGHAFHTLSNGPNCCIQICHFKTDR